MDMIINKLSRIVNGTLHSDNWRDIAGYATLAMVAVEKAEAANAVEKARASAAAAERAKTAIKQAVEAPPAAPDTPVPVFEPEKWPASQPIDDNEILDSQVAQHQGPFGRSLHCSFWRSMAK